MSSRGPFSGGSADIRFDYTRLLGHSNLKNLPLILLIPRIIKKRSIIINEQYTGTEDGTLDMQTTPEPTSMTLLGGGALLVWLRKRKHRQEPLEGERTVT